MKICVLDGESITSRSQLHDILEESLNLPEWYGRNLDALYDCLTDMQEEIEVHLIQMPALEANLGRYAQLLLKVMRDASEENSVLQITVEG